MSAGTRLMPLQDSLPTDLADNDHCLLWQLRYLNPCSVVATRQFDAREKAGLQLLYMQVAPGD